ncbi:MAG: isocitrate lyase/phosphoenolpyruvate mutase family protein [Pseudomonadota bacterium]
MTDQQSKARDFRNLHVPGKPLLLFNIWDAGSAKAVEKAGARALATGSWSVAAANGFDDGEKLPVELAMENMARIAAATPLPVSLDIESGYGRDPQAVALTIQKSIAAGAIGCNLEDSFPENGKLRDANDQIERVRHARQVADRSLFFINARTDVFFQKPAQEHDDAMLEEAVRRANAYAAAGADGIFVPGLADPKMIARFVKAVPLPVNIMISTTTPSFTILGEAGAARLSHGPGPYLTAMKALEDAARKIFAPS